MYPGEFEARKEITYFAHKVHAAGLVSATDGNLSVRLGEDRVLITPSSLRKEDMFDEAPIIINMNGDLLEGERRPSTELKVHLEAYKQRPDVRAVIHAHPPKAIAFTIAEAPFETCILPEVVVTLGDVPVAPYATPSTEDLPRSMSDLIRQADAIMLARHGSVTVGSSLSDAFKKLEKLEHNAEILIYARILGGARPFPETELQKLQGLREFYGVKSHAISCTCNSGDGTCGIHGSNAVATERSSSSPAPAQHSDRKAPEPGNRWAWMDEEAQAPTYRRVNTSDDERDQTGRNGLEEPELYALVSEIVKRVHQRL